MLAGTTRLNFCGQIKSIAKQAKPNKVLVLVKVPNESCNSGKEWPNNGSIWERMINTPIPEVKPDITGYDTRIKYLPSLKKPNNIWNKPASVTTVNAAAMPLSGDCATKLVNMATMATVKPVLGPEICWLVPPNKEANKPVIIAQ